MTRHCLKPIDGTNLLCSKPAGHLCWPGDTGCCAHQNSEGNGKTSAGRLRRRCKDCGTGFLVSDAVGQEYLHEEELCYEVSLLAHSSLGDYEIVEHADKADEIRIREGGNPDAIRAIASATFEKKYDPRNGRIVHRIVKLTFHNKSESIRMAGKRFGAFPDRLDIVDADRVLARITGVPADELPPAE